MSQSSFTELYENVKTIINEANKLLDLEDEQEAITTTALKVADKPSLKGFRPHFKPMKTE